RAVVDNSARKRVMSGDDFMQRLRDNRATLLACEAIGWVHMAGKAHPNFLRQSAGVGGSWPMTEALLSPSLKNQRTALWQHFSEGLFKDALPASVDVLLRGFMRVEANGR